MDVSRVDAKGFVYLDGDGWPFFIRLWGKEAWLFIWFKRKQKWKELRRATNDDMKMWYDKRLSDHEADEWHDKAAGEE